MSNVVSFPKMVSISLMPISVQGTKNSLCGGGVSILPTVRDSDDCLCVSTDPAMISLGASRGLASPTSFSIYCDNPGRHTVYSCAPCCPCVTSPPQHTLQPRRQPGMLASQEATVGESQIQCLPGPWGEFKDYLGILQRLSLKFKKKQKEDWGSRLMVESCRAYA